MKPFYLLTQDDAETFHWTFKQVPNFTIIDLTASADWDFRVKNLTIEYPLYSSSNVTKYLKRFKKAVLTGPTITVYSFTIGRVADFTLSKSACLWCGWCADFPTRQVMQIVTWSDTFLPLMPLVLRIVGSIAFLLAFPLRQWQRS